MGHFGKAVEIDAVHTRAQVDDGAQPRHRVEEAWLGTLVDQHDVDAVFASGIRSNPELQIPEPAPSVHRPRLGVDVVRVFIDHQNGNALVSHLYLQDTRQNSGTLTSYPEHQPCACPGQIVPCQ